MERPARGWAILLLWTATGTSAAPLALEHLPAAAPQIRWVTPSPLPFDFAVHPERFHREPAEAFDPVAYERAKARAAQGQVSPEGRRLASGERVATAKAAPAPSLNRPGLTSTGWHPPDGNGAIGPTRFFEVANGGYALYDRSGQRLQTGSLDALTGDSGDMFDPVALWDPHSRRFYYVITHNRGYAGTRSYYNFGYSRTDTPSGAADFCHYQLDFNYADAGYWIDFEKMGTTTDFIIFTGDVSGPVMVERADAQWLTKPAAGATCQDPGAFTSGIARDLRDGAGNVAYAVQPARQVDPAATGWLIATSPGSGNALHLWRVRRDANTGAALITRRARSIPIAPYEIPPDAVQQGTTDRLDTGGTALGLTSSARDPGRGGVIALWTVMTDIAFTPDDQTISVLRWFEVDPASATLLQEGRLADPQLYLFNGAIAPDRVARGSTRAFGDAMVLAFNTASATTPIDLAVVSKAGDAPVSARRVLWHSPAPYTCPEGTCRWGDYAGAAPDPGADPTLAHGRVWVTQMAATAAGTFNAWQSRFAAMRP